LLLSTFILFCHSNAFCLYASMPGEASAAALERALMDSEALIRRTAVNHLLASNPQRHIRLIAPLLYDPVKAVRIPGRRADRLCFWGISHKNPLALTG
jgi:hypothetical protein